MRKRTKKKQPLFENSNHCFERSTAVRKTSVFIKDMELPVGETYRDAVEKLVRRKL